MGYYLYICIDNIEPMLEMINIENKVKLLTFKYQLNKSFEDLKVRLALNEASHRDGCSKDDPYGEENWEI